MQRGALKASKQNKTGISWRRNQLAAIVLQVLKPWPGLLLCRATPGHAEATAAGAEDQGCRKSQ